MSERRYGAFAIFTADRALLTFVDAADVNQLAARLGNWADEKTIVLPGDLPGGEKVTAEELPEELEIELRHAGLLRWNSPAAILAASHPQLSERFPKRRIFTLTVYENAQQAAEALTAFAARAD